MKNTGFILFGLAVCAAADVCAQSTQLELGGEDIAGAAVKEEKLDFGPNRRPKKRTLSLLTIWAACISTASEPKSIIRQP